MEGERRGENDAAVRGVLSGLVQVTPSNVWTGSSAQSFTLSGLPTVIRDFFREGRIRYVGQTADTVQMSVQSVDTPALRADTEFAISIAPASGNWASPAIAVAERIALQSAGNSVIQFVNKIGRAHV